VDDGRNSSNQICRDVAFEFLFSPEVVCGNHVLFLQNKRTPAATRKPNHKYTSKYQNNQNLGKQIEPTCVKYGSMNDSYGRREYAQRGMCNVKKKWTTLKMNWARVDIKNSMFQVSTPYYLSSYAEISISLYCFLM